MSEIPVPVVETHLPFAETRAERVYRKLYVEDLLAKR
jgi:hypothetical protein